MTEALWTSEAAAAATGGEARHAFAATGVAIDSRELERGDLFVALAGEARDGHGFVADALKRGAAAAMVTHRPKGVPADAPLLVVGDTLAGLTGLAAAARARSRARVLAVTGSVGKTSTKDMLAMMLATHGRVHAAERSFNNHWGVPLTLARLPRDCDFAVLEIGMNHAGEIAPLSRLARPELALVTCVRAVHLEHFSGIEAIADAKAEIFEGLAEGGIAVVNAADPQTPRLLAQAGAARVVRFGEGGEIVADHVAIRDATTVVRATLGPEGGRLIFRIGAAGRHFAENACAALACVAALGLDTARAALELPRWHAPKGRGARERVRLGPGGLDGEITLIDESFNANPASMRAALEALAAAPVAHNIGRVARGRRIVFLGDMLELGPEEIAMHASLATSPEIAAADIVHCCGPRMRALHAALPRRRRGIWAADSTELAARAGRLVDAGDVCMVKGSKGARMGPVLAAIRRLGQAKISGEDG
ncbi:UDP-N-acetylmuramoyl-tripeptide--D-alanyl-D-alanine ligase [Paralimibaculum aggregatum]|uniref:UDP-N-acetylmuramoyl-tripeptide--D-alanyl-D-alanine ligase n=1 Tax=Paralimibaculum aggregatum TaxID=3036245 RepID=A0ABQ6LJC0_9RHOB|nr:UDP-N-acetylmuramoyl-tripeptide--D-alanyl-D-alanine ligase [Limibaculum sp. NKW23]GMG82340.1 UDP-N-acetylmuramoyl-tripeptide--D-alanyl-D-alanine ligase [Limibaculum sp. NKW23]